MAEIGPAQQQILDRLESIQASMHAQDQLPATPERKGNLLGRIFGGHRGERQPAREPAPAAPPAAESSIQWQHLAKAVGKGVGIGIWRYIQNVNPATPLVKLKERDLWWLLGGATGFAAAEASQMGVVAAAALKTGLPVGAGLANIGINVAQGIVRARSERGDQSKLQARLEEISKKFPVASQRLRRFAAGFSAGTLYGAVFSPGGVGLAAIDIARSAMEEAMKSSPDLLGEAGKALGAVGSKVQEFTQSPPQIGLPEMPDVIGAAGKKFQEITGGDTAAAPPPEAPPAAPAPDIPAVPAVDQEVIAAAVGAHLDVSNQAVDKAIESMGFVPKDIPQEIYEQARLAVQHRMEDEANWSFNPANYPDPTTTTAETFTKNFEHYIYSDKETDIMTAIATGGLKNSLLAEMTTSEPFRQAAAAAAGAHLDTVINSTLNEVLAARGLDPTKVSPETLQKIHQALQHQLENFAGREFTNAAAEVIGQGSLDPAAVADPGNRLLADFLAGQTAHDELIKTATEALGPTQLTSFDLSSVTSSNVVEKIIPQGSTVGHMLFEAGVQTGWGADNANLFAAEIAANYDLLGSPIPLDELKSLAEAAKNGDVEALKKLHAALRWVPAGAKLKILSKAGVAEVLAGLPG